MPKLLHLHRTADCSATPVLCKCDSFLRQALSHSKCGLEQHAVRRKCTTGSCNRTIFGDYGALKGCCIPSVKSHGYKKGTGTESCFPDVLCNNANCKTVIFLCCCQLYDHVIHSHVPHTLHFYGNR